MFLNTKKPWQWILTTLCSSNSRAWQYVMVLIPIESKNWLSADNFGWNCLSNTWRYIQANSQNIMFSIHIIFFEVNFQPDFRFYSVLFVSLVIYHSKFKLCFNIKKNINFMRLHNTLVECIDEQIPWNWHIFLSWIKNENAFLFFDKKWIKPIKTNK